MYLLVLLGSFGLARRALPKFAQNSEIRGKIFLHFLLQVSQENVPVRLISRPAAFGSLVPLPFRGPGASGAGF